MEFEWDPDKDLLNQERHGISFTEASTVFGDPLAQTFLDSRPDFDEYRFLTVGYTTTNRLIIVAHTDRGDRIRIITARDIEPKERRFYEQ